MIINKERGTGKTHDLITVSHYTGCPIIVTNFAKKDLIKNKAKDMGYDNIPVYTIEEWRKGMAWCCKNRQVLIDDAEFIMERALNEYIGAEVLAATITLPIEEVKKEVDLEQVFRKGFEEGIRCEQSTVAEQWEMFSRKIGINKEEENDNRSN